MRRDNCNWTPCNEGWSTQCGELYCIVEGTPKENGMNYCTYCGGELRQQEPEKEDDDS